MRSRIDLTDFDTVHEHLAKVYREASFPSMDAIDEVRDSIATRIVNENLEYNVAAAKVLLEYLKSNSRGYIKSVLTVLLKDKGFSLEQLSHLVIAQQTTHLEKTP